MHTSQRISKFYEDLEKLELRFPGKELAALGYSKGYVSDVINKKKEPSEEFIKDFYKKFSNGSQNDNYNLPLGDIKITLQDYINLLHRENERLYTILNSTLGQIHEDSRYALAYQKAWVKYEAERSSAGNKKKENEIRYKMSKLVDDEIHGEDESGNPAETDKLHKGGQ